MLISYCNQFTFLFQRLILFYSTHVIYFVYIVKKNFQCLQYNELKLLVSLMCSSVFRMENYRIMSQAEEGKRLIWSPSKSDIFNSIINYRTVARPTQCYWIFSRGKTWPKDNILAISLPPNPEVKKAGSSTSCFLCISIPLSDI